MSILTLCFNFLVYFKEMSSYYSMKAHKRKVRKCLKSVKEFLHRSDLVNQNFVITVLKTKLLLVLITVDFITILCFFRDDHLHLKLVISCLNLFSKKIPHHEKLNMRNCTIEQKKISRKKSKTKDITWIFFTKTKSCLIRVCNSRIAGFVYRGNSLRISDKINAYINIQ